MRVRTRNHAGRAAVIAGLVVVVALILPALAGWGYYEDIETGTTAKHSTFHYELTRTLARAAGFTASQAETIAVADQAVDVADFKGDPSKSPRIRIKGTGRVGPAHQYYHFPRRRSTNSTGEYKHPGGRSTCSYFASTSDPCAAWSEVDELERWAVYATGAPSPGVPKMSVNGAAYKPVAARSIYALAIYLHSLADSYSHEACMKSTRTRDHHSSPSSCTLEYWHLEAEYGPDKKTDIGVPYTREAGMATWRALNWYRKQVGLQGDALWSDEEAKEFANEWVVLDAAQERRDYAVSVYQSLNNGRVDP